MRADEDAASKSRAFCHFTEFLRPFGENELPRNSAMLHHLLNHPAFVRPLDGISETLNSEVSVQLALFAASVGTALALIEQGVQPAAVCGLSVRTFVAAVTAGVLGTRVAAELVRFRAEQMVKLYPVGYGLAAMVELNESQVTKIVQVTTSRQEPVFVANINAQGQIVIAGSNGGTKRVLEEARRQGASKAVRLQVAVPSHCPLLQPVATRLGMRILSMTLGTPRMFYVTNVNALPLRTNELVANDLANNITHGVRWHDTTGAHSQRSCPREPFRNQCDSSRDFGTTQGLALGRTRGGQHLSRPRSAGTRERTVRGVRSRRHPKID